MSKMEHRDSAVTYGARIRRAVKGVPSAAFVIAAFGFLVLPLVVIVPLSFTSERHLVFPPPGWSLQWYEALLQNSAWRESAADTLVVAVATVVISTVIGTLAAFPLVRQRIRGRTLLLLFVASPIVVPEITIAIGIFFTAFPLGLTDRWWSVAAPMSVLTVPVSTLIIASALRGFDRTLEDAAASLGASPFHVLFRVTLPLLLPAIASAAVFSFIFAANNLLIPLFMGSVEVVPLAVRMWVVIRSSLDLAVLSLGVLWVVFAGVLFGLLEAARRAESRMRV